MSENNAAKKKLAIKQRSVKDLADYIRIRSGVSPNYSLFLGAGASVTSGIRTGYELVQEWRQEIYNRFSIEPYTTPLKAREYLAEQHPDWYDQNNEYSSLFEKKFDLPSQRRRFVELQVDKKLPSIGYAYLVELFESNFFDTVFTTNFDDLINEAFYQFSSDRPLLCAHDSSIKGISITSTRPKIIKLHGDYLFDSIKSSLKETESLESNTREKLIEFTKEYGLIFVGYAGNDNSIMDVLKYLLKQDDYLRNGIYWCIRKEDDFTPELFKLLNLDKVYWVEIDGFDEFMAELVHELGGELSLGGNQKSTKRERMINNFVSDDYHLEKNQFIKTDLTKIKKHTLTRDISALINELSQDDSDDQRIPEEDFKNLLSIDNLIRSKKHNIAEEKLNKLINDATNDNIKSKYLRRLIEIKEDQKDTKSALEYSDKLIELDEFNLSYALSRANIFTDIKEKITYLKGLLDKFKYSINLKNHLCRISLTHLETSDEKLISFKEIHELIESSLLQDNNLDNNAWKIKYEAIKCEHISNHDKNERDNLIKELLEKIKAINPTHNTYMYIYSGYASSTQKKEDVLSCIETLSNEYKVSSKNKKKNILRHLTQLHLSLFEADYDKDSPALMKGFIDEYEEYKNETAITPFIIFKARYELGCNKNINAAISLAKEAMDSPWRNNHIQSIVDILLIDKTNIPLVEDFLENLPRDTSKVLLLKIKADISNLKGEHETSINYIEEAYKEGWDFSSYILGKAYTYLLAKEYIKTIKTIDNNLDKIKDVREKDVLVINRELAKKKLGREIIKHEVRTILSHHKSKGDVAMCAFFLLDEDKNANKQLQNLLDQDYMNFFRFSEWPALPKDCLSSYQLLMDNAA
ncbi:SIR2 family protein [Raoultella terrigena]|uniref:SIR2 family protein n=1 Tax=Raoultella terrigena TaxID=577 RepID=UPI002DBADB8C|nr:SIR2 family protein [Raoultella terrigena]MEB8192284.1 SIR2 family protein [Raoultella terrigena]